MKGLGPQAQSVLSQFLQPYDEEQFQGLFQKAFIDPAMMSYQRDVIPGIKESMISQNLGSSGSLNQALAASAQDLSTGLGKEMGGFYGQQQAGGINALSILSNMLNSKQSYPLVQQNPSMMSQWIGLLGAMSPFNWGR